MRSRQGRSDRRYRRYDVVDVGGSLRFTLEVRIVDISAGGIQIETAAYLGVGRRYGFKLRVDDQEMVLDGRVAWCSLSGTRRLDEEESCPVFRAGIAFEGMLSEQGKALMQLVDEALILELEQRVFGRFRAPASGMVRTEGQSEFAVERLSLAGMLIASDVLLGIGTTFDAEVRLDDTVLQAHCCVAYAQPPADDGGRSRLGVEFLGLSDTQREALSRFIETEFTQEDPRLT